MFNIVFDPSRTTSLHFITNTVSILIDRSYPIRLGIVPLVETEGARIARVFYYLTEKYGRVATMPFFDANWTGPTFRRNSKRSQGEGRVCHSIFWPAALPKSSKRGSTRLARTPNGWGRMRRRHPMATHLSKERITVIHGSLEHRGQWTKSLW
ncbi:hypothetical protein EDB85DRAFT_817263 [Lactarius pseudohatsudake]|nr:hypothetical protein EDB85DRAFT_817263 [Lactarius pseudohatsudake]